MPAIPTGQLTRAQIIDLALRRSGNVNVTVRTDAIAWLNEILFDLYTQWSWPFLCVETTVSVGATFSLPTDFLRTADDAGLMVETVNGAIHRYPLAEIDREAFERFRAGTLVTGLPTHWTADYTTGIARAYPTPDQAVSATLRYHKLPAPLADDTDVPEFPWHNYLMDAVYVRALEYEFDARATPEKLKLESSLARLRRSAYPFRQQASTLLLDPHVFGPVFDGD